MRTFPHIADGRLPPLGGGVPYAWLGALTGVSAVAGSLSLGGLLVEAAAPGAAAGWGVNLGWTAAGGCALAGTLAAALRRERGSHVRRVWLLFAAGAGCWTVGAVIRDAQGTGPVSAATVACWAGFAVLCISSFSRRLTRLYIISVFMLDAVPVILLIVALAEAASPALASPDTPYHLLLRLCPVLYLLLAANAIQTASLLRDVRSLPASVCLFTLGFVVMAVAALFWVPVALTGVTPQGHWTAPLWSLGLLAVGAGGVARARATARVLVVPSVEREGRAHALAPTAAVLIMIVLLPFTTGRERVALEVFLLVAALSLFVRVYLMRREDIRLLAELSRSRQEAERSAERAGRSAQRLRLLADLTPRVKSLVLDELLQTVCNTTREVVGAGSVAFVLTSEQGMVPDRMVTAGLDAAERGAMTAALARDFGFLGTGARNGCPGTLSGLTRHPGTVGLPPGHPFGGSLLNVPVPLDSPQRGALYLAGKDGGFDGEDKTLATLLASNAGQAIANAQLYAESRAQQEQLASQNERLRDLDRLKDEFVALVSHELRTPLTSIIGYLELMQDQEAAGLTATQRTFTDIIERNAKRLLRLVGDLLFLSRIQSGKLAVEFSETDLTEIIEQAIEEIRPAAAAKHITLGLSAQPLPRLNADGTRLAQLAANLLSNAVKFTPQDGDVTARVGPERDSAMLVIADTGIGMSGEEQQHVFERFYRAPSATDRAIEGTGLGLTISKAIVEAHNGSIEMHSAPGRGTTFVVRIPFGRTPRQGMPPDGMGDGG